MKTKKSFILICFSLIVILLLVTSIVFGMKFYKNSLINSGYGDSRNSANQYAKDVTIVQLIASPEKYDNELVRVIGVGNLEFEGNCLSLSKEDLKYNTGNSIWIELGDKAISYDEAKQFNGEYVIVEGIFDKDDCGHMDMHCGSIKNINRYELWNVPQTSGNIPDEMPAAYAEIISNIQAAYPWEDDDAYLIATNPELSYMYCRHLSLSEIGYALIDLDSDSQQELIISGVNSPYIYDLYTITDGKAVHLFSSGDRYSHYIYADGNIELQWSSSATVSGYDFYKLSNGRLEFIERITYDVYHSEEIGLINEFTEANENNTFFKSTSENEADYINISFDEATKTIDSYQNSYKTLNIEYKLLSEF